MIGAFVCGIMQGGCGEAHGLENILSIENRYLAPCGALWVRRDGKWSAIGEDRPSPTPITPVVFCTLCGEPSKHAEFHQRQICSRCYEKEM